MPKTRSSAKTRGRGGAGSRGRGRLRSLPAADVPPAPLRVMGTGQTQVVLPQLWAKTILTSWISSVRRSDFSWPALCLPRSLPPHLPLRFLRFPLSLLSLCPLRHRPPPQWPAHPVSGIYNIFLQAPCRGDLCDPVFIGFASVHMTHVVTLVAWLSHSMYVCVLVFSFRWAHMSQLLTSPRLGFATMLGGGGGICYYYWVVVHLHEVHTPLQ